MTMSFFHMCDCNNIGHNAQCQQDISFTYNFTWESLHAGDADIIHQVHRNNLACRWQLLNNVDETAPLWQDLPAIGGWPRGSPRLDHIKHLVLMHEGEIREVFGEWVWRPELPPTRVQDPRAHHVQFSTHRGQFLAYQGLGAAGGDKTWEPAVGGDRKINRIIWHDKRNGFYFRQCKGFALAELMLAFGSQFSAAHLYHYYCGCRVYALKRVHPNTTPVRKAAARQRYETTGRWGWPREEWRPRD